MTVNQWIKEFGGVVAMAKALGVTRQSVWAWKSAKAMPEHWQALAEKRIRNGKSTAVR